MTLTPILYVTLSGLFLDLYVCLKYFVSAFEPYIIVTVQHYLLSHYEYNLILQEYRSFKLYLWFIRHFE